MMRSSLRSRAGQVSWLAMPSWLDWSLAVSMAAVWVSETEVMRA